MSSSQANTICTKTQSRQPILDNLDIILPCSSSSFLLKIHELCKLYDQDAYPSSGHRNSLGQKIDLEGFEVSTWFQGERDHRSTWSKRLSNFGDHFQLSHETGSPPSTPVSQVRASFLCQVCGLREGFQNDMTPSPSATAQYGRALGLHEYEVSCWFEKERANFLGWSTRQPTSQIAWEDSRITPWIVQAKSPLVIIKKTDFSVPSLVPSKNRRSHPPPSLEQDTNEGGTSAETLWPAKRSRSIHVQTKCLFSKCDADFTSVASWRDHQLRVHFPKQAFICWMQRDDGTVCNHGPVLRADNFLNHLLKEHHLTRGPELDQLVQRNAINMDNLFHDRCGFCREKLSSREKSLKHIGAHIRTGLASSEWHHCCATDHNLKSHLATLESGFTLPVTRTISNPVDRLDYDQVAVEKPPYENHYSEIDGELENGDVTSFGHQLLPMNLSFNDSTSDQPVNLDWTVLDSSSERHSLQSDTGLLLQPLTVARDHVTPLTFTSTAVEPQVVDANKVVKPNLLCKICPAKRFKRAADLRRHIDIQHNISMQISCDSCPKVFRRKDKLREHYRVFHLEDLGRQRDGSISTGILEKNQRLNWWRCTKCLQKNDLDEILTEHWICQHCSSRCEQERVVWRTKALTTTPYFGIPELTPSSSQDMFPSQQPSEQQYSSFMSPSEYVPATADDEDADFELYDDRSDAQF